ncbi:hypothetical protein DIPPA_03707 [Diplonema papillatum]|nr:hypothetical protein DIPPA_03707 [Diplonema papillatum]
MVTVRALRSVDNDEWSVINVEIMVGGAYQVMHPQTWGTYPGVVSYHEEELMEPVFTVNESVLFRIETDTTYYAGSTDRFSIYFHTYYDKVWVADKIAPAAGEVAVFAVMFDKMDELSYINIAFNGTASDGWWVDSLLVYRNRKWDTFVAPDAAHQTTEKSAWIDDDGHPDVEWFDLSERPLVNRIQTQWTTRGDSWSGTTNIYLVFYHSETVVHFAGAIYDTLPNHVSLVDSTDCPFPIEELRMVSVNALKGHIDDGWWLKSVEMMKGSTWETMWSPTWQSYGGGMIAEHDDTLKEPVFTMTDSVLWTMTGR